MYSFGMTICAIFNQGRPLIQANHNCSEYLKQLENVSNQINFEISLCAYSLFFQIFNYLSFFFSVARRTSSCDITFSSSSSSRSCFSTFTHRSREEANHSSFIHDQIFSVCNFHSNVSFIHISRISFTHFFSKKEKKYLELILFFRDPPVYALQFLDVSKMKDALQKEHFYTTTLKGILPYIPRVILYLYTR